MPFAATWMEIIILTEVSQRKTNIMWYHLHTESFKKSKLTSLQNRNRLTKKKKKNLWLPKGTVKKGDKLGVWD